MPSVEDVVKVFKAGFQYLNSSGQRQEKWYELWYKSDFLRKNVTDVKLTTAIEEAVKTCNDKLDLLIKNHGQQEFHAYRQEFLNPIVDVLNTVQAKRFQHGKTGTRNFEHAGRSIFQRVQYSKNPGLLEQSVIQGLNNIKDEYNELTNLIDEIIKRIEERPQSFVLFHESMGVVANGRRQYSDSGCMSSLADHIATHQLSLDVEELDNMTASSGLER
ncbi:hypothetical protein [Legionella hackeliae]|uniref:Uncharacterized protein n=1 Tax=Legionella hackeliae TaxID=449 RepID=A0A0A8UN64_LEGHA|nr:hypothetical protein [Legionella hackeliae]KTD08888.1 hypothetical protein Lhac_3111 [Legionella hackeliae]CEK10320.1 protein of unknown function [Legionella hackeliae]STX47048.1 Uncharacterised protein [Legionella hackeliae]